MAPDATDYAATVREAMRLGGCSASRCLFVGACSAALAGKPPPDEWLAHFDQGKRTELAGLAEQVAGLIGLAPRM